MNETILTLLLGNAAVIVPLFLWVRSEANADRKEAATDRRDILQLIRAVEQEIKDFHGLLCAIEEKRKRDKDAN